MGASVGTSAGHATGLLPGEASSALPPKLNSCGLRLLARFIGGVLTGAADRSAGRELGPGRSAVRCRLGTLLTAPLDPRKRRPHDRGQGRRRIRRMKGTSMLRYSSAAVVGVAALLLYPADSLASGGTSIASAPTLAYGLLEAGGGSQSEFWRMPVTSGDRVTFDIDNELDQDLDFRLRPPTTTDYTVRQNLEDGLGPISKGKTEVSWLAPFSGDAVLWITNWRDSPERMGSYTFTATVTHAAHMTISAPVLARHGTTVTTRATVTSPAGTPEGACLIQGTEAQLQAGQCAAQVRLSVRGRTQKLRASFVPADGWQAASASRTIRLAGTTPVDHPRRRHRAHRPRHSMRRPG